MFRENHLESALRRLLDCTELNLDEIEEETRSAIRQAQMVVESASNAPDVEELVNTMLYIGENVETMRIVLEQLVGEVVALKKIAVKAKQGMLFES